MPFCQSQWEHSSSTEVFTHSSRTNWVREKRQFWPGQTAAWADQQFGAGCINSHFKLLDGEQASLGISLPLPGTFFLPRENPRTELSLHAPPIYPAIQLWSLKYRHPLGWSKSLLRIIILRAQLLSSPQFLHLKENIAHNLEPHAHHFLST